MLCDTPVARSRTARLKAGRRDNIASPYLLIHLGGFAVLWTGASARALMLGLALYVVRIFAIGAGYHRYFAHRAFRTSRVFQFGLAFLSLTSAQRGILWWGGGRSPVSITCILTPMLTYTRRSYMAFSTLTSAGSFCRETMPPTTDWLA